MYSRIARTNSPTLRKVPRRMRLSVISAKKRSTKFSQEAPVGVNEVPVIAGVSSEPGFHRRMRVCTVIIQNEMDIQPTRGAALDVLQKKQKTLAPRRLTRSAPRKEWWFRAECSHEFLIRAVLDARAKSVAYDPRLGSGFSHPHSAPRLSLAAP